MVNYKGFEIAGMVVGAAIVLSLFVVFPAGAVVANAQENNTIFGITGNGPATKRHKKRRKSKSKSYKRK
jgi:hypothetical protein